MVSLAVLSSSCSLAQLISSSLSANVSVLTTYSGYAARSTGERSSSLLNPERFASDNMFFISAAKSPDKLSPAADCLSADLLVCADIGHCASNVLCCAPTAVFPSADRSARRLLRGSTSRAVCCGASACDTITFSSISSERLLLSIQRTTQTISGKCIEPCELPVFLPEAALPVDHLLVASSVLLLCGCPIEDGGYRLRIG